MSLNRRFFLKSIAAVSVYYSNYVHSVASIGNEISIKLYGANGDGNSDDSQAFLKALTSSYSNIFIPSGTYLINEPIELNFKKNLHIKCEQNVRIKLGNNVRRTMFVFMGDNIHDFSWDGGELDGNWEGQNGERKNIHSRFDDVSHGIVLAHWNNCNISNIFLHDFMGHHVNHAGNLYFHAKNIKIKSHISTNFPDGGARGDGITGASVNNYFENISGFCTDDLIGLFSGVKWLPKVLNSNDTIIKNVYIRNVYANDISENGNTYYTWHAITIGISTGFDINKVFISNVTGLCKDRGVGIVTYVTNHDYDYFGSINHLVINKVNCTVIGFAKDSYLHSPVVLGEPTSDYHDGSNSTRTIKIKIAELSEINCDNSYNLKTCIVMGNVTINTVIIDNVSIKNIDKNNSKPLIAISGPMFVDDFFVSNLGGDADSSGGIRFDMSNEYPMKLIKVTRAREKSYGNKIKVMFDKASINKVTYSNKDFSFEKIK